MSSRPRVGISRCLLGDEVRYDGTHRRADLLLRAMTGSVEWIPVCPEVEVGMGTPREPIHLVSSEHGVRSGSARVLLVGETTGRDWTDEMCAWACERAEALRDLGLDGFVLKARSPSCGPAIDGKRGLFAEALLEAMPDLPVADEIELGDGTRRELFLRRVLMRFETVRRRGA